MGKKSRMKMSQPVEKKEPNWFVKKWQAGKDKVYNKVQDALDQAQQKAVEHYIKNRYFMELSGCNHPNFIKWDDPQISLTCKLCDIRNLKLIRKGKHRDEFLAILTDEERDLYLNHVGYDGVRYTDLEDGSVLSDMVKGIKEMWKESRKKGKQDDMTPEEEQAVMDALDSFIQDD